tara:strand:- start:1494 stop:1973 length:480 start_codon:yes stop_codon:yes gene_type:complete
MTQERFGQARQAAAQAILQSQAVTDFIAINFPGQSLNVFREVIPGSPPSAEFCPYVAFGPFTHAQLDKAPEQIGHDMPVGIFLKQSGGYSESEPGLFVVETNEVLDALTSLVEGIVSKALLEAGFAYEQDPYHPDDVSWDQYFMSFYLYRVKTTRRINL